MPLDAGAGFITEKNKQQNRPVYLYRVFDYDGSNDLYFTNHDEDVTFDGQVYTSFPVSHDSVADNTSGEIDQVTAKLANVSREIQAYLETYDWRGLKVTITAVFLDALADAEDAVVHTFYIDNYTADEESVSFVLTTKFDLLDIQLPLRVYNRNHCGWKFKSSECGYVGSETVCNKTKQDCRDNKSNVTRFGGFPSIPQRRLYT